MTPTAPARDALLLAFSRALAARDMDALYRAVAPDFLWSYHDGVSVTKSLTGAGPISDHLAEQNSRFSAQRFHGRAYPPLDDRTHMTMSVRDTVRTTGQPQDKHGHEG